MTRITRTAAALSALLILANCAATPPEAPAAPPPDAPTVDQATRSITGPIDRSDLACLAEAIYFEARGTGPVGTEAVAHVVVNRARSPKFPDSVCAVVGEGCQFSYRCDGRPDVLADPTAREKALRTAETVLQGARDITQGAVFFHAARIEPGWFATRERVGTFGGNVFYR